MEEVIHPVEEVIHTLVILVSAQVLLVLTLGLRTLDFGLGLDNNQKFRCPRGQVYRSRATAFEKMILTKEYSIQDRQ